MGNMRFKYGEKHVILDTQHLSFSGSFAESTSRRAKYGEMKLPLTDAGTNWNVNSDRVKVLSTIG